MAPLEEELHRRLGTAIYGRDGDTLASVVVELLASFGQTLATAESCTGGLLAGRITDVPGASEVFGLGSCGLQQPGQRGSYWGCQRSFWKRKVR